MLYQLSYLGAAARVSPRPTPDQASGAADSSSSAAGAPGSRYCSVNQRPRSIWAQRGEQNGRLFGNCGLAADGARDRVGHGHSSIAQPHGASAGSEREDQGSAGAPCKVGERRAVFVQRRNHRRRGPQRRRRRPDGRRPRRAIRRSAARPAASGPASSSCSGGWTRGRTISASPSAVNPSSRGRSGSAASAAARSGPSAARRFAESPARSTRIAPDRLRSRICRASAGSAARFSAGSALAAAPPAVEVDRDQCRRRMEAGPHAARQRGHRVRQRPRSRRRGPRPTRMPRAPPARRARAAATPRAPRRPPAPARRDARAASSSSPPGPRRISRSGPSDAAARIGRRPGARSAAAPCHPAPRG